MTAGSPAELIERAALLESAGVHRSDVLTTVTVLQRQATESRDHILNETGWKKTLLGRELPGH